MDKPNIFKRSVMLVVHLWRRIMNVKFNPLKYIPDPSLQAYFMLVLFVIWSVTFGFIATYYIGWLGYSTVTSIAVHLTILIPIVITNAVFANAMYNRDTPRVNSPSSFMTPCLYPKEPNFSFLVFS